MIRVLLFAWFAMTATASAVFADPVKVGLQPWLGYGPLWVAKEKGYFQKYGVDVALTTFNWDQDMTAALASGNLDVIAGATNGVITNFNQGVDQKGFLIMDVSFQADAVIAAGGIADVAALKGKKVAFESGSTSDLLINYALKVNSMKLTDIEHVPMGASEAGLALVAGRVDAAVTYEPYISAALVHGPEAKIIYTAAEKPGLISDVLSAKAEWIKAHPAEVNGLIRAWDDAITFIRANPVEGGDIIAKAVGASPGEFEPAFKGVKLYSVAENVTALKGDFQATVTQIAEIMKETNPDEIKMIPTAQDILSLENLNELTK